MFKIGDTFEIEGKQFIVNQDGMPEEFFELPEGEVLCKNVEWKNVNTGQEFWIKCYFKGFSDEGESQYGFSKAPKHDDDTFLFYGNEIVMFDKPKENQKKVFTAEELFEHLGCEIKLKIIHLEDIDKDSAAVGDIVGLIRFDKNDESAYILIEDTNGDDYWLTSEAKFEIVSASPIKED